MLDWAGVEYPSDATAGGRPARLGGASLLPLVDSARAAGVVPPWRDTAFGSHQFHSLYAYYPMRSVRTPSWRLVHNLAYNLKFPILEDVEETTTWRQIEAAGEAGDVPAGGWVYNYSTYMVRPEWQLFDVVEDPLGLHNLAHRPEHAATLANLQQQLRGWQMETHDPWAGCNPGLPQTGASWLKSHSEICSF